MNTRPISGSAFEFEISERIHEEGTPLKAAEGTYLAPTARFIGKARGELALTARPWSHTLAARYRRQGADVDDLRSIAFEGVLTATGTYDPRKGPFAGYATPFILGALTAAAAAQKKAVAIPEQVYEQMNALRKGEELKKEFEARVNDASAWEHTGTIDSPDGAERVEQIPSSSVPVDQQVEINISVTAMLAILTPRERLVIATIFELDGGLTLDPTVSHAWKSQIAAQMRISAGRVTQIQDAGLARLRRYLSDAL
jgi:RNA polymerase sigma factor (sigma-70 family)